MKKHIITDESGAVKSEAATIMRYYKQQDETIAGFSAQLKELSPTSKTELAIGAARELGWTVTESE